jgi:hypothetical protein
MRLSRALPFLADTTTFFDGKIELSRLIQLKISVLALGYTSGPPLKDFPFRHEIDPAFPAHRRGNIEGPGQAFSNRGLGAAYWKDHITSLTIRTCTG